MPGLVSIMLRGSKKIIKVVPMVARARVAGGTADYVNDATGEIIDPKTAAGETNTAAIETEPAKPETAALAPGGETATSSAQNPPKKSKHGR
jgi:hypothetical protein